MTESLTNLLVPLLPLAQVLRTRQNHEFGGLRLWPASATTMSGEVDTLFVAMIAFTTFFTLLVFVLIVFFALKFRRRAGHQPVQFATRIWMEVTWTAIPTVLVLGIFVWSARVYARLNDPPAGAMRIDVVGKQWMWKVQHPAGRREVNELHVPTGVPVELLMTSEDTIHSFFLPAARVKHDVLPGRYTSLWFEATTPGTYRLLCAEYCGTDHSKMGGRMVVMTPQDYAAWLSGDTELAREADVPVARAGEALFSSQGCASCHGQYGPTLAGVYGREQRFADGTSGVADDDYLRESILYPNAKLVAGYPPLMPTYAGRLSEGQVMQLIAYLRTLGNVPRAAYPGAADPYPASPDSTTPTTPTPEATP